MKEKNARIFQQEIIQTKATKNDHTNQSQQK
jgi:hypothetical protein